MTERPTLLATYRLQFSKDFTFADATALVPYLRALGVSHLYASPIFRAREGSEHGYDVIDHDAISSELGGEEGLRALAAAVREVGLGLIADIVPNHAGVGGTGNVRWQDVLEFGRRSRNARFFDIDWAAGPLVLPILEDRPEVLAGAGRFGLAFDGRSGRVVLTLGDQRLPLRPKTVSRLLTKAGEALQRPDLVSAAQTWSELETLRAAGSGRRERRGAIVAALQEPEVAEQVLRTPSADEALAILGEQHYRLMYWREGAQAINYRRFFDINELAGLRVEEPAVFDAVHRLPLALVREGILDGLRVDHVDGLADPTGYCARLRAAVGPDVSIHVEKILGADEPLPDWAVEGTTGYETVNLINGLFVDAAGYGQLAGALAGLGVEGDVEARIHAAKAEILERSFHAEIEGLARLGADLSRRHGHPVRLRTMREILIALIAALPVYRTYITETARPEDVAILKAAAETSRPALRRGAKRAMQTLVSMLCEGGSDPDSAAFVRRFQQLTGPAMAKGYEDTELYRSVVLASVNEVGSHLTRPTVPIPAFHKAMSEVAARGLTSLTPLSTHDTKRGADTRARLNALSEMPSTFLEAFARWRSDHEPLRSRLSNGREAPDTVDEWILYQTLIGAWPVSRVRIEGYLTKAMREAKRHTSWTDPDEGYEAATLAFAAALVEGDAGAGFRRDLQAILAELDPAGRRNTMAQTVLQLTVPGIPDIYRGSEFMEFVLVDPDNRRPVDWGARIEALRAGTGPWVSEDPDAAKQRLIASVLALRRSYPGVFRFGDYQPLSVVGADDVLAFARHYDGQSMVVATAVRAAPTKDGTVVVDVGALPPSRWHAVTGGTEVRSEGRLLRIGRGSLPTVVLSSATG